MALAAEVTGTAAGRPLAAAASMNAARVVHSGWQLGAGGSWLEVMAEAAGRWDIWWGRSRLGLAEAPTSYLYSMDNFTRLKISKYR